MNKKIILTCIIVLNLVTINCQTINGDFESFTFSGGHCEQNFGPNLTMAASPFVACDFSGWFASHGSPEIFNNGTNRSASMWSGRWDAGLTVRGEGIHTYCYFLKDQVYHLTLKIACSTADVSGNPDIDDFISNVYIKLGNGVPFLTTVSYNSTSSYYDIPSVLNSQTLLHYTNFNSQAFQNVDIYFIPNDDYNSLWIYPLHSNGQSTISVLFVDDVVIEDCIPDITYSNNINLPTYTLRNNYIHAINNTQVTNGQNVTFIAGDHIYLGPNFSANLGSNFSAIIGGCEPSSCTNPFKSIAVNSPYNNSKPIEIYPNPNLGEFMISINSLVSSSPNLYIMDLSGRILHTQTLSIQEGTNQISISKPELPSGIYFIKIDGFDEPIKMIISQ